MSTTLDPATQKSPASASRNGATLRPLTSAMGTSNFWRSSAPDAGAEGSGDAREAFLEHLRRRRTPRSLGALCKSPSPLAWGLSSELLPDVLIAAGDRPDPADNKTPRTKQSQRQAQRAIAAWLDDSASEEQTIEGALAAVGVAYLLADPTVAWSVDDWWQAADRVAAIARNGSSWHASEELSAEAALAQQLLAGELPLTLAYLFPEISPLHKLRGEARDRLSEGLAELLNGAGLWHGSLSSAARPLVACWTRCRAIGTQLKKGAWSSDAEDDYRCLVTAALQWSTPQGGQLLDRGDDDDAAWSPDFLQAMLKLGGDSADRSAALELFGKKLAGNASKIGAVQPEPADHCEWAGLATMRTNWSRRSPILGVDYSGQDVRIDFWHDRRCLVSGVWASVTTIDGKLRPLAGEWEEVCWESDDDVDYIELSVDLEGGGTLERQILLAHDEEFLLLADNIHTDDARQIEHRWQMPLSPELGWLPAEETCEGLLADEKTRARLFPLALPEWRADSTVGRFDLIDGCLQLEQRQRGCRLSAPVVIDFCRRRHEKECTWRQLTVAEALEHVPRDVAVGYRWQAGKDQYLFYRSLAAAANRTLIGQNLASECYFAKFLPPAGEVELLLEIES